MKIKGLMLLVALSLGIGCLGKVTLAATSDFQGERVITGNTITVIDEKGNITEVPEEEGRVEDNGIMTLAEAPRVVNFNVKASGVVTDYIEEETGETGYTYGAYGADAAYLGTTADGKVRFMLAGVIGKVNANDVQVIDKANVKEISHYYVSSGRLYHKIITNLNLTTSGSILDNGPAPSYLKAGIDYYSYDGHYFYTEGNFENMLNDYNNKTRVHSMNASSPFFNYFQYLPFRSTSNYSGAGLNTMLDNRIRPTSKMKNIGDILVNSQNTYGTNALLMTGIAANESAWGMSSISQDKNNLFGLNAVDSSPGQSANYFASVSQCIKEYSEKWLSKEYLNPRNWKYFGGFLGNKASGLNVKYASDPYWGEKAAALAWSLDASGGNKDINKYTIGIKDIVSPGYVVNVRNQNNTSCTILYQTPKAATCAYLILDDIPANKFYKIQSDGVLQSGRTGLNSSTGVYNFSEMYAYLSSDYLQLVSRGKNIWSVEKLNTSIVSPQPANTSITLSADIIGNSAGLQYKFVWMKDDWKEWGVLRDFSSTNSAVWKPGTGGNYTLYVDVKDNQGKTITKTQQFKIIQKSWEPGALMFSQATGTIGKDVVLTQSIKKVTTENVSMQYKFVWMKDNWKEWGVIQDFSSKNVATWKPGGTGDYTIYVDIKDEQGFKSTTTTAYIVKSGTWEFLSVTDDKGSIFTGDKVKLQANVTGNTYGLQYKFVWMKDNWKEWGVVQTLSGANSAVWTPETGGSYTIIVDIRDSSGKTLSYSKVFSVKEIPFAYNSISISPNTIQNVGSKINITPVTQGSTVNVTYKYVWMKDDWKEWGVIKELSSQNSIEWIPKTEGNYTIYVDVKCGNSTTITKSVNVNVKKWQYTDINISMNASKALEMKPVIEGNVNGFTYKYVWMKNGWKEWDVISNFSSNKTVVWNPWIKGQLTIYVDVKDAAGNVKTVSKEYNVK